MRRSKTTSEVILEFAKKTNPEAVNMLLQLGARINAIDKKGRTALMYAARGGHLTAVRALLQAGADVNFQSPDGNTALMLSASKHDCDPQSVAALLKAGADVEARNKRGLNALMCAIDCGNLQAVEALLKAGADPETRKRAGDTALICAARKGSPEIVTALLKAGAGIDVPNKRLKRTALIEAARYGNPEVITVLLKAGAKTSTLSDGWTALTYAAFSRSPETVAAFLDQGVDAREYSAYGVLPIKYAQKNPKLQGSDVLRRLRIASTENYADNQKREGWTPLMLTIMSDPYDHEAVAAMLNSGIDIEERNTKGDTALIIAARYGRLEAVKVLLEAGADLEAKNQNGRGRGRTALMEAVRADEYNRKVVAALLSGGANLEVNDRDGNTALFHAVIKNKPKAIFALLKAGANIETREKYHETAFMWAVSIHRMKAAAALLKAGADVNASDEKGRTVITMLEERTQSSAKRSNSAGHVNRQDAAMLLLLRGVRRKTTRRNEREHMAEPQQAPHLLNERILPWKNDLEKISGPL